MFVPDIYHHNGEPASEVMETDSDRAPSLHLDHTDSTCSSKQNKQEKPKKNRVKAAKKRPHKDGENSQLDTEEGEDKAGESDQVETEDGTHDTSQMLTQTDCEQWLSGEMKRQATTQEALERNVQDADSEQYSDDEASQAEDDTNPDEEFVHETDSSRDSVESKDPEETVDLSAHEWKSKNGQIVWSPTNAETLLCSPATDSVPGPSKYAIDNISTLKSCFDLFMIEEIISLILHNTNLKGRRSVKEWKDIDVKCGKYICKSHTALYCSFCYT